MPAEPPVRVGNGSVTVRIESAEAGVEWVHQGAAQWIRRGPPSDSQGTTWIVVNGSPIPVADEVRVRTSDGDLFFAYRNGRTFLNTTVTLVRRDPDRRLLSTPVTQIFDAAIRGGPRLAEGEEWELVVLPSGQQQA